jgi:hypothetical protein
MINYVISDRGLKYFCGSLKFKQVILLLWLGWFIGNIIMHIYIMLLK